MNKFYAGIGSQKTPIEICNKFTAIAYALHLKGYILRSGGADGADSAFEGGLIDYYSCHQEGHDKYKEIFLPWKNFNNNTSQLILEGYIPNEVVAICKDIYRRWDYVSDAVQRLHARNVYQILGHDLDTPVEFVVCWSDRPLADCGGTMFGVHLAQKHSIPVYNFINPSEELLFNERILNATTKNIIS